MVKNGCGHPCHVNLNCLYLKNELIKWTDFLSADINSVKLTLIPVDRGRKLNVHKTSYVCSIYDLCLRGPLSANPTIPHFCRVGN